MDEYFIAMNEKLCQKYYPHGYFARDQKNLRSTAKIMYVFLGFLAVLAGMFTAMCIYGIIETIRIYEDVGGTGFLLLAVGLFLTVFSIGAIVAFAKRYGMTVQQWMEKYSIRNALPITDMQEFDQQVCMPDSCLLLRIAGKKKALLEDIGTGLLTRDYIAFHGYVIRRDEVAAACFFDHIEYIVHKYETETIHILHLGIVSKRGVYINTEVKQEAGEHLISLLKQNSPNMETWNNEVLTEEAFQAFCTRITKQV